MLSLPKSRKVLFVNFLLTILLIANIPIASAINLGLSNRKQIMTNWCWAACAQTIGWYYGNTSLTQANICNYVMGNTNNQTANIYEAATAIQYAADVTTTIRYRALSESEVQQEINTDMEPFEIRIGWNGSLTNGHFIVCGGYSGGTLRICNPLDANGTSYTYSYSDLVSGVDITGGYGRWTHSTIIS
ncbi:MAG: hypothetical protein IJ221_02295 [Oscillibacter sp.]|nr:hypothetical protein [Oscillibacter sp.]